MIGRPKGCPYSGYGISNQNVLHSNTSNKENETPKLVVSPLSNSGDPRVKKLKKELERLDIKPQKKPKYIEFKV